MKTPQIKNVINVYEPSEDSFLLLDALESDLPYLTFLNPLLSLEIGTGSGIVGCFLKQLLPHIYHIACDINPDALIATSENCSLNRVDVECVVDDLGRSVRFVDLVVFNPPYVESGDGFDDGNGLAAAWAGGARGRKVIDRTLPLIASLQSVFYILLIDYNQPHEIIATMASYSYSSTLVLSKQCGTEKLVVLRFNKRV